MHEISPKSWRRLTPTHLNHFDPSPALSTLKILKNLMFLLWSWFFKCHKTHSMQQCMSLDYMNDKLLNQLSIPYIRVRFVIDWKINDWMVIQFLSGLAPLAQCDRNHSAQQSHKSFWIEMIVQPSQFETHSGSESIKRHPEAANLLKGGVHQSKANISHRAFWMMFKFSHGSWLFLGRKSMRETQRSHKNGSACRKHLFCKNPTSLRYQSLAFKRLLKYQLPYLTSGPI